ncbi:MAG: hypothetical protein C0498_05960 [Anaerolinea sp.]|jgi:hypothetical protein|nr:hypothetical protein [Anaerolinea sp.]
MSEVIYARVPSELKAAADEYARENDRTTASALAVLIDRGLRTTSTIRDLERRVVDLEGELAAARARAGEHEATIVVLLEKQKTLESAYQALADRMGKGLGRCPACEGPVTGQDLLVSGRCPNAACQKGLASLLVSQPKGLDERELLLLIGALGLVLGIALMQTKNE